jgi:hypothetical protein
MTVPRTVGGLESMPPVGSQGACADSNPNYEPKIAPLEGSPAAKHGCNVNVSLRFRVAT